MSENAELVDAVIKAASDVSGRKKITCAEVFELAERFGATKAEVGRICNAHNIRISECQLGCFK